MVKHVDRILLVEAPQVSSSKDHTPPLGLGYLAEFARQTLPEAHVQIVDSTIEQWSVDDAITGIAEQNPDVVGLTANSHNRFNVIDVCRGVKARCPKTKIVLGGPHFSYTADDALHRIPEADFVVRGEGERTFADLLQLLPEEDADAYQAVAGLSFRSGNEIVHNDDRKPMENIDISPAWDLFQHDRYHARLEGIKNVRAIGVTSSRGCPFRCAFCANRNAYSRRSRLRSPEHFVDELEMLRDRYGYDAFDIWDDTFTLKHTHVEAVCREIFRRRLNISWYARIRANTTDNELLSLMREAGCRAVGLGVESGSVKVLASISKDIHLDDVRRIARHAVRLRMHVKTFFIHCLPGETEEDLRKTRDLMYDLRSYSRRVRPTCGMTLIYPGTELEQIARQNNSLPESFSWNDRSPCTQGFGVGQGCVPYFEGATISREAIKKYVKQYRPSFRRVANRRVTRLLMRLPLAHRLVR